MTRWLPYPLLTAALLAMWLLLNGPSAGHIVLGSVIALAASKAMAALHPAKPRLRRWSLMPRLAGIVFTDILRSNIAVSSIILQGRRRERSSGFVAIPLKLRDPTALAVLAVIVTSTPGTAWLEYRSASGKLLLHVLDLIDEQDWIDLIQQRYEPLLMEMFE